MLALGQRREPPVLGLHGLDDRVVDGGELAFRAPLAVYGASPVYGFQGPLPAHR
jgi:hypothetical protein